MALWAGWLKVPSGPWGLCPARSLPRGHKKAGLGPQSKGDTGSAWPSGGQHTFH